MQLLYSCGPQTHDLEFFQLGLGIQVLMQLLNDFTTCSVLMRSSDTTRFCNPLKEFPSSRKEMMDPVEELRPCYKD